MFPSLWLALTLLGGTADYWPRLRQDAGPFPDWRTADYLPGVDLALLEPRARATLLDHARTECCTCGCSMSIAECHYRMVNCYGAARQVRAAAGLVDGNPSMEALDAALRHALPHRGGARGPAVLAPAVELLRAGTLVEGDAGAPVEIVEFADIRDGAFASSHSLGAVARQQLGASIRVHFRFFPNEGDADSWHLAELAMAVAEQGRLVDLLSLLARDGDARSVEAILDWAAGEKLDVTRLRAALESRRFLPDVRREVADARSLGLDAPPGILVNGREYRGPLDSERFVPLVEDLVRAVAIATGRPMR